MEESNLTRRDFVARMGGVAVGLAAGGLALPPALAGRPRGDRVGAAVPTAWFDLSLDLVRSATGFSPPVAARAFSYAGLALYEAVVPGMPGYRSLGRVFGDLDGLRLRTTDGGTTGRPVQMPRSRRSSGA